jgi:uncharacterized protein with HEPN domain
MLPKILLKYILDIENIINEIEQIKASVNNNFFTFKKDFVATRAIERQLEIIGEAINKINKINPDIKITGVKSIICLRNLIAHAYDSVDLEILWGIIQKDIPVLKKDLEELRS